MEKGQSPLFAELTLDADSQEFTANTAKQFGGTGSKRQERALHALSLQHRTREGIDRITGASNGPDVVAKLRKRGLDIPCRMTPGIDRDGKAVTFGVYYLTTSDRRKLAAWKRAGARKGVPC